jgi:hypothetical protein
MKFDSTDFLGGKKSGKDQKWGLAQATSTRVRVSFHSDEGFDGVIDTNPEFSKNQPFKVTGFSLTKRFGSTPGTFVLTLKSHTGADLLRLWRDPEDVWVIISAYKNGELYDMMLGLIDTVTEVLDRGLNGQRSVVYQVRGRDFQKIFTKSQIFINIHEHSGDLPAIPIYDAMRHSFIGSPDNVVKGILNAWLGNDGVGDKQWKMPKSLGGRYFFDALELVFDNQLRGIIFEPALFDPTTYQGQGLWQLIEEFSNGLLNELYTELDWKFNSTQAYIRPRLILRERPFPSIIDGDRRWETLDTTYLNTTNIRNRSMSRGAPESRFNYWLIDGKGLLGNGLATLKMIQDAAAKTKGVPGSAPIYDIESIRKHGLRRWQNASRYLPFRDKMDLLLHSSSWLQLLHDWYAVAPYELSGTIVTNQLFPFIHIGKRLVEGRRDGNEVTYYVEGVTQSWNYPSAGSTTINVTRGEYADEHLLDIVYESMSGENQALESVIRATVDLVQNMKLPGDAVPTGSGPQLDRMVGQAETPEQRYLVQRGKLETDAPIKRGEVTYEQDNLAEIRVGDLPDRQVPEYAEATQRSIPKRRRVGVLSQEELEKGARLPISELRENELEPAQLPEDAVAVRVVPRTRVRGQRKR